MDNKKYLTILGIETSCDETAASLLKVIPKNKGVRFEIISNVVSSQVSIHRQYGGIVPEMAARAHIGKIIPVIESCLKKMPRAKKLPDLIAVTSGPGLITSLLVGVETAKTLSYVWQKPLLGINHLKGHVAVNFMSGNNQQIFPAVCLIVSGGHSELVLMKNYNQYQKIGQTRDDAAGECFDKVAKLLNIGYPRGPVISQWAEQFSPTIKTIKISLPRPMINSNDFDFSFSGLKTAVFYLIKKQKHKLSDKKFVQAVCAETQQAIVDVLVSKTIRAAKKFKAKSVILCGGVAANKELRKQLKFQVGNLNSRINFLVPPLNLCTDNAVMIAAAAYFKFKNLTKIQQNRLINNWQKIKTNPNLEI